ncbi:MAG TPA: PDZ domain-containing protein [Pyrinomonadaceae bacterium]
MTLKSLNLLFVSLILLTGASALGQQAAPATPRASDAPAVFSFFEGGSFLGVYTEDINKENMGRYGLRNEPRGVGVKKVVEGSPAERAGLREGDVILKFDNEPTGSVRKLNRLISEVAPEHTARLTISRGGDEKDVSVTLGKRNEFNSALGSPGFRLGDLDKLRDFKMDDNNNQKNFSFVFGNNRRIGITTTQLTKQLADFFGIAGGKGLLVTSVREDSPAAKAGLRAGDVITEADGNGIETVSDLMRAINRKDEGEMTLTVVRDKSQRAIRLTPERGKDSNTPTPGGVYVTPGNARIALPSININLPEIVIPATPAIKLTEMQLQSLPSVKVLPSIKAMNVKLPKLKTPGVHVLVPARVLTLPSTPL